MRMLALLALLVLFPALGAAQDVSQETIAGEAMVLDGDTMLVDGTHVRLHGIAAPALSNWPWGAFARATLDDLAHGKTVACHVIDRGPRRHMSVRCTLPGDSAFGDKTLGEAMIRAGFAAHQRLATHGVEAHSIADRYDAAERAARAEQVGIWGLD